VSGSRRSGRPFVTLRNLEIRKVRRIGSKRRVGGIVIFGAPVEAGPPRVAVTAGREVGSAVDRNRAKRRLREAVALAPIRHGRAYVLIATPAVLETPFRELAGWVRSAVEVEDDK
jgi:ribonuclease P protein component